VPQIGSYSGSGVGLSSSADEVVLFDGAGNLVTGVGFGASPGAAPYSTFDNHAGVGGNTLPLPVLSTLSASGINGAAAASGDANEIGSPGIGNVGRLLITEVSSWSSSGTSYAADCLRKSLSGIAASAALAALKCGRATRSAIGCSPSCSPAAHRTVRRR
jgi:hypothetical protein